MPPRTGPNLDLQQQQQQPDDDAAGPGANDDVMQKAGIPAPFCPFQQQLLLLLLLNAAAAAAAASSFRRGHQSSNRPALEFRPTLTLVIMMAVQS